MKDFVLVLSYYITGDLSGEHSVKFKAHNLNSAISEAQGKMSNWECRNEKEVWDFRVIQINETK